MKIKSFKEIRTNVAIHFDRNKTNRYYPIIIILFLLFLVPTVWLSIKHGEFTTICDYKYCKYFISKLRLEVFIGLLISFIGIFISFLILHSVNLKSNIENIDEFLEHLIRFLKKANKDDEIKIVSPTLYFGKTSKKNRLADKYIFNSLRKFQNLSNVEVYSKQFDAKFCNNSNSDNFINELVRGKSELVDFHLGLLKSRSDKPNDHNFKEKYFREFCQLYTVISSNTNIKPKEIPDELKETNIILFLNTTIGEGLLGVFDEKDNYSLNANYIENQKSVYALKRLYENHNNNDK